MLARVYNICSHHAAWTIPLLSESWSPDLQISATIIQQINLSSTCGVVKNASHFCTGSTGSTTADLILKILEKNLSPQSVKVSAVMSTPPPISIEESRTIEDTREMMRERNFRHLTVTCGARL
tara:strand:- start:1568 stop:1936 length:369 start_codon:yes stop_codon:yes gene_type:complete